MKKLCVIFSILFFCSQAVFAADDDMVTDDNTANSETITVNQEIEASNNKVVIAVQKQPLNENSNQKIVLKKNWFVVFVQVNGKIQETEAE